MSFLILFLTIHIKMIRTIQDLNSSQGCTKLPSDDKMDVESLMKTENEPSPNNVSLTHNQEKNNPQMRQQQLHPHLQQHQDPLNKYRQPQNQTQGQQHSKIHKDSRLLVPIKLNNRLMITY